MKQLLYPLLYAASGLYGFGVRVRLWLYRRHLLSTRNLPLRVISIGNLTAGGTGKTPHTALVARYLRGKGIKIAVLSHGYRGTKVTEGAVISDMGSILGTLEEGGEEPYWLAKKLPGIPVVVGRDRFRSGWQCFQQWRTEWVILDDGFQHLSLEREINILLLSGQLPLDSERLLPLGFLREPLKEMRRADIIVVTHAEELDFFQRKERAGEIRSRVPSIPVFFSEHKPRVLRSYPDKKEIPLSELTGKQVVAFCGLAYPDSLMFSLRQLQADPVQLVKFPDHHYYREKDKRYLETLGRSLRVPWLVTTEKDDLKLGQWAPADLQILVLGIEVEIQDPAFWELLDRKIDPEGRAQRRERL
ncbi:MAG: tetraacyldisaccharide 4'-kinase [Deltaproteobacteria bacterium]|nr:tetraacyldisaccharide 4'-kinase [Deltaproteobacteria bacterium]